MPSALDSISSTPPRILIYGPPGYGKTVWAMTAGKHALMIDIDRGFRSGVTFQDKFTPDRQSVEVNSFTEIFKSTPTAPTVFPEVKKRILEISDLAWSKKLPYKVFILDALSSLAEHCLRYVRYFHGTTAKGGAADGRMIYGLAMEEITNLMLIVRSLPLGVIVTSHSQRDLGDGATPITELAIYGKGMPEKICGYFDEVFFAVRKEVGAGKKAYLLQTSAAPTVTAKTRTQIPDNWDQSLGVPELFKRMGWPLD